MAHMAAVRSRYYPFQICAEADMPAFLRKLRRRDNFREDLDRIVSSCCEGMTASDSACQCQSVQVRSKTVACHRHRASI